MHIILEVGIHGNEICTTHYFTVLVRVNDCKAKKEEIIETTISKIQVPVQSSAIEGIQV